MQEASHESSSNLPLAGIAFVIALYIVAGVAGWPQLGRDLIVASAGHHDDQESHEHGKSGQHESDPHETDEHGHAAGEAGHHGPVTPPGFIWVTPFVLLLLAIAVLPLLKATEHWWESNLHRFYVAAGLGVITLIYYAFFHGHAIESHWPAHSVVEPVAGSFQLHFAWTVFANAILHEFIPFIVLLFSLYSISGGIRIEGDLRAHPITNTTFIAIGGLLASFIGTTGAAMLLIRPLLETNSERKHVRHTVILFIFVVCNCGGCLLPIGDPPLFLGYLRGVPFLWTMTLLIPWLFVNVVLLAIYWVMDHFFYYPKETVRDVRRDETQTRRLRFRGLGVNGPLLVGVILAVALLDCSKEFPGTHWHPWMYLREVVQLGLVGLSLLLGRPEVRQANRFNFHAIIEVAALFLGIFICMQPALQILGVKGPSLGVDTPTKFFWATGTLSSFLDNAPTYVVFFQTASTIDPEVAKQTTDELVMIGQQTPVAEHFLIAISLGAVFMGAMTYIGNGPNFMVKAIAESSGVRMPSFFGYMAYSCAILLPLLVLTTFIFF